MFEIKLIFLRSKSYVAISQFVWTPCYSVWDVFNNFLHIDATDRSKISSDEKRFFIALSPYPLSFSRILPLTRVFNRNSIARNDAQRCVVVASFYALGLSAILTFLRIDAQYLLHEKLPLQIWIWIWISLWRTWPQPNKNMSKNQVSGLIFRVITITKSSMVF